MSAVGICSFGRKQSQRCPNKMLRPFAGTTLTDIVLEKLARCGQNAFYAGYEEDFCLKARAHGVQFVQREEHSVHIDGPIVEILSFLRQVDFEHILLVSGCAPFLRLETIKTFLADCLAHDCQPACSVAVRRKHFLTTDRRGVNFDTSVSTMNTKRIEPLHEVLDACYFFRRREFLERGRYWDWLEVRTIELPPTTEIVDIDTEEEFTMAEALWKAQLPSSVMEGRA